MRLLKLNKRKIRTERMEMIPRLSSLSLLQQLKDHKPITVTNKDFKQFSNVKNAILYLDPPYENTTHEAYEFGRQSKRKVAKEKYKEIRERLLKLEKGAKITEDGFVFYLGEHKNNQHRMYVKDAQSATTFDSKEFYSWAYAMSQNNIVILSSYEVSDPRFEMVYEFDAKSTPQGGAKGRTEKLFMVKKEV